MKKAQKAYIVSVKEDTCPVLLTSWEIGNGKLLQPGTDMLLFRQRASSNNSSFAAYHFKKGENSY